MHKLVTPNELIMLKKYASQSRLGIVEIGVLDGGTTRELIASSSVQVCGIDPIVPDSNDANLVGNLKLIREIDNDRFTFYHDYSYNVVPHFKHGFDLLFIDGDHRYESVKQDFEQWSPLMEIGSVVAFHDANITKLKDGSFGPARFIDKEMVKNKNWELVDKVDSLQVFKRIL
jgi:hypothetical protein